jgi:Amt family ammonium transporter
VDYLSCAKDGDISTCDTAPYAMGTQLMAQLKAVGVTVAWSAAASAVVFLIIRAVAGLRVTKEAEYDGLDISEHGERAYHP